MIDMKFKIKCPRCGSTDVSCMDGADAIEKYGYNVMLDIAPDMWLCNVCKESFRLEEAEYLNNSMQNSEII